MSSGEGLDISYYSAHLARALKKNDVLYKQVDDLICCIVDEDKVSANCSCCPCSGRMCNYAFNNR